MSVSSTNPVAGPFTGNGVTTAFPFTFAAVDPADVKVLLRSSSGDTVLTSGVSITLSGSGGTATVTPAPPVGVTVSVYSDPSFAQLIQFEDGSRWLAGPVNEANDRAAIRDLALRDRLSRTIGFPIGENFAPLPPAAQRLGKVAAYDPITGAPIVVALAIPIGATQTGVTPAGLMAAIKGGGQQQAISDAWPADRFDDIRIAWRRATVPLNGPVYAWVQATLALSNVQMAALFALAGVSS